MTWLALLRRAWAVWKLRRRRIGPCISCGIPCEIEAEIRTVDGRQRATSWECIDCQEERKMREAKAYNDIPTRQAQMSGFWERMNAFSGLYNGLGQANLAQQQQQFSMEQQRRLMEQQMNTQNPYNDRNHDLLQNLLGRGIRRPDEQ